MTKDEAIRKAFQELAEYQVYPIEYRVAKMLHDAGVSEREFFDVAKDRRVTTSLCKNVVLGQHVEEETRITLGRIEKNDVIPCARGDINSRPVKVKNIPKLT